MDGFMDFVRKQGVVGMAVGLSIGAAVAAFAQDVVDGLVSPLIGALLGDVPLNELSVQVGDVEMVFGKAITSFITFLGTALVVYVMVKAIGADKWDAEDE